MVFPELSKKKVTNLRVSDLKLELEKRGLDQKGVKAVLVERLQTVGLAKKHKVVHLTGTSYTFHNV